MKTTIERTEIYHSRSAFSGMATFDLYYPAFSQTTDFEDGTAQNFLIVRKEPNSCVLNSYTMQILTSEDLYDQWNITMVTQKVNRIDI